MEIETLKEFGLPDDKAQAIAESYSEFYKESGLSEDAIKSINSKHQNTLKSVEDSIHGKMSKKKILDIGARIAKETGHTFTENDDIIEFANNAYGSKYKNQIDSLNAQIESAKGSDDEKFAKLSSEKEEYMNKYKSLTHEFEEFKTGTESKLFMTELSYQLPSIADAFANDRDYVNSKVADEIKQIQEDGGKVFKENGVITVEYGESGKWKRKSLGDHLKESGAKNYFNFEGKTEEKKPLDRSKQKEGGADTIESLEAELTAEKNANGATKKWRQLLSKYNTLKKEQ